MEPGPVLPDGLPRCPAPAGSHEHLLHLCTPVPLVGSLRELVLPQCAHTAAAMQLGRLLGPAGEGRLP